MKNYIGKKGKDWNRERRKVKKVSLESNQMYCQFQFDGCEGTLNLGYSHPYKRVDTTEEMLSDCVLACGQCHRRVENVKPQSEKVRLHEEAKERSANTYYESA